MKRARYISPYSLGEWLFFEVYITQEDGKKLLDGLMCAMFCFGLSKDILLLFSINHQFAYLASVFFVM